jgi:hypothetical protein
MSISYPSLLTQKVAKAIARTNYRKTLGYDLRTGKVLKELPRKAVTILTIIYNSMLRFSYYPLMWKFAQIVIVPKPGKPINDVTS